MSIKLKISKIGTGVTISRINQGSGNIQEHHHIQICKLTQGYHFSRYTKFHVFCRLFPGKCNEIPGQFGFESVFVLIMQIWKRHIRICWKWHLEKWILKKTKFTKYKFFFRFWVKIPDFSVFEQIPGIFQAWKSKWQNSRFSRFSWYHGNPVDRSAWTISFMLTQEQDDSEPYLQHMLEVLSTSRSPPNKVIYWLFN